jgi:hypothetical protein
MSFHVRLPRTERPPRECPRAIAKAVLSAARDRCFRSFFDRSFFDDTYQAIYQQGVGAVSVR